MPLRWSRLSPGGWRAMDRSAAAWGQAAPPFCAAVLTADL